VLGDATDAAPTFYPIWFNSSANTSLEKFQGAALGAAPYGFWFCGTPIGSGLTGTAFMMDPVTGDPADADAVNFHSAGGNSNNIPFKAANLGTTAVLPATTTNTAYNPAFYNVAKTIWLTSAAMELYQNASGAIVGGSGGAISPFSGNAIGLPVFWFRVGILPTAQGPKGVSSLMRWTGVPRTTSIDTAGALAWICMGDVYLPWDGVTVPTG
jgi:hypothetical protein